MKTNKQTLAGFTLIELLVVISIIAIVSAIAFGVLAKARDKGKESICLSNLHQLSVAMGMYRADWDGEYPRDLRDCNKPYINNTRVYYCPYDTRPAPAVLPSPELAAKGFGPGLNNPSYMYHSPPLLGRDFTQAYQKHAEATALVVDRWHNPSEQVKVGGGEHYIVLRVDGSVHSLLSQAKSSLDL